jgi:hypothetical protein
MFTLPIVPVFIAHHSLLLPAITAYDRKYSAPRLSNVSPGHRGHSAPHVHYHLQNPQISGGKRVSMECDICRTLAQQLRSYEMEIDDTLSGNPHGACVAPGSSLDSVLEESRKTRVLYQHHRNRFHESEAIESDSGAVDICGLAPKAEPVMSATPFWPNDNYY